VRCWCWPGNSNDQAILTEVKDDMRDWKLGRVITVVDRGFSSADNLAYLRRAGGHYIAGMRMRDGNPLVDTVLARQGRYQQIRDNLRVKEVTIDGQDARFVICHNPDQAQRDAQQRTDASPGSRPNWPASASSGPATPTGLPATSTASATKPRMYAPSAPCATTPPWDGG